MLVRVWLVGRGKEGKKEGDVGRVEAKRRRQEESGRELSWRNGNGTSGNSNNSSVSSSKGNGGWGKE